MVSTRSGRVATRSTDQDDVEPEPAPAKAAAKAKAPAKKELASPPASPPAAKPRGAAAVAKRKSVAVPAVAEEQEQQLRVTARRALQTAVKEEPEARATSPDVPKRRPRASVAAAPASPRAAAPAGITSPRAAAAKRAAAEAATSTPPAARRAGVKSPEPARKPAPAPAAVAPAPLASPPAKRVAAPAAAKLASPTAAAAAAKKTAPLASPPAAAAAKKPGPLASPRPPAASPPAAAAAKKPAPVVSPRPAAASPPPFAAAKKPAVASPIPEAHKPLKKPRSKKHGAAKDLASLQPTLLLFALLVGLAFGARIYLQAHPGAPGRLSARAASAGAVAAGAAREAGTRAAAAAAAAGGVGWQTLRDARELYQTLYDAAKGGYQANIASHLNGGHGGAQDLGAQDGVQAEPAPAWDAGEIAALLPEGSAWEHVASSIADRLRAGGKAAVLLLGCGTAPDCAAATDALPALRGVPPGCALRVEGFELAAAANGAGGGAAAAAALQSSLASFLGRCPSGLVVMRDAQLLPPDVLPALHGAASGPRGAAFALLAQLPGAADARAAALGQPSEVSAWLQATVFDEALGGAVSHAPDQERAANVLAPMLRALKRRVDFAAPLRLGPEAAEEAEAQAAAAA